MDPFSALASAIAIAGLAEKIITKSVLVVNNFRHAPSELVSLTTRVHILQDLVRRVQLRRQKLCLAKEIEVSVYNCFIEAEQVLAEIINQSEEYTKPSQGKDKRLRLKWAFKGSHQMSVWDVRLQGIVSSLYGIFLLMLLDGQDSILAKQEEFTSSQHSSNIYHLIPIVDPDAKNTNKTRQSACIKAGTPSRHIWTRRSANWLWFLGFLWFIQRREGEESKFLRIAATLVPPRLWFERKIMINFEVVFESLLDRWKISARHFNINALNVVSNDSDIVYACRNGVLELARQLFMNKRASIYDVTSDNMSLLSLAIEARSISLVRFLLDQGASVDQTFGNHNTSVLQWALFRGEYEITRLILEHGPDGTHLSTWNNWNCLMYLLQGAREFDKGSAYSLADFLMLLNRDNVLIDTSSTDDTEMQALELASCWYSGDIISRILALGAPITLLSNPWGYPRNPILYSIYKSDFVSFQALLPYYKDLDAKDADGYTMLSYTARSGNTEMTDLLLKMGAEEIIPNYKAISEVGGDEMDEEDSDSEGREELETAWDATRLIIDEWVGPWTAENYGKYMNSLERYGRVVITRSRDGSESDEIFWDIITN